MRSGILLLRQTGNGKQVQLGDAKSDAKGDETTRRRSQTTFKDDARRRCRAKVGKSQNLGDEEEENLFFGLSGVFLLY